jgi:hypothetical protein
MHLGWGFEVYRCLGQGNLAVKWRLFDNVNGRLYGAALSRTSREQQLFGVRLGLFVV